MPGRILKKIERLEIENFRGFGEGQRGPGTGKELDANADIVLLTGPNGYGKSSVLQAIEFLLTGCQKFGAKAEAVRHRHNPPATGSASSSANAETEAPSLGVVRVKAVGSCVFRSDSSEASKEVLELTWSPEGDPDFRPANWPRSIRVSGITDPEMQEDRAQSELLARVTTFYPEQVDNVFRLITTGKSLRDVYQPIPKPVDRARIELSKQMDPLEAARQSLEARLRSPKELQAELNRSQSELAAVWEQIRRAMSNVGQLAGHPLLTELASYESITPGVLTAWLAKAGSQVEDAKVGARVMERLLEIVQDEIVSARKRAADIAAPEGLRRAREEAEEALARISRDYPHLDQFLACFSPDEKAGLPDLLSVFQTLTSHRDRWMENAGHLPEEERSKLQVVLKELEAVITVNARQRGSDLDQWLRPLREAAAERERLHNQLDDLDSKLERYRMSQEVGLLVRLEKTFKEQRKPFEMAYRDRRGVDLLIDGQHRIRSLQQEIDAARSEVEATIQGIDAATGPSRSIHEAIAELTNMVLSRFALVEGIRPVKVREIAEPPDGHRRADDEPHTEITTNSGLRLEQLSTGQKAQMAVALVAAQAQLLRRSESVELPYHVLLLDDVSTAYDLANISREAILWRQLAYHSDPGQRWQLFITSHHEDLTNHLLDLLIPPDGARLVLLKFTGWSFEEGPTIEQYEIEPSLDITNGRRERLKKAMTEALCQLF
jgi:energy-coupling factor transporter ATP-binding protein EcfA2